MPSADVAVSLTQAELQLADHQLEQALATLKHLRSVAPPRVRTSDIYWGAVPFVGIQMIMVALIIAFPALVTVGLDRPVHSGEPAPVQLLRPQDDPGSFESDSRPDDAADLFERLPKP
jgi:hypothetical protein